MHCFAFAVMFVVVVVVVVVAVVMVWDNLEMEFVLLCQMIAGLVLVPWV